MQPRNDSPRSHIPFPQAGERVHRAAKTCGWWLTRRERGPRHKAPEATVPRISNGAWRVVGLVSAYAGGAVDLIVQRIVDTMMAIPGLAIFIAVLGFNLSGDALRDVLEPRLRGASGTARLQSR